MPTTLETKNEFVLHKTRDEMIAALCLQVTQALSSAIRERGRANLAVSGGSTPKPLYQALSSADIDWEAISVLLVDERWVDPGQTGSNEDFVRNHLLQDKAANASFYGLKNAALSPASGLHDQIASLPDDLFPLDVTILGMGNDGHTASWFPDAEGLHSALAEDAAPLAAIRSRASDITGAHTDRMTLSLPPLRSSRLSLLMLTGEEKRKTLELALADGPVSAMPVRALLRAAETNLHIHWSP